MLLPLQIKNQQQKSKKGPIFLSLLTREYLSKPFSLNSKIGLFFSQVRLAVQMPQKETTDISRNDNLTQMFSTSLFCTRNVQDGIPKPIYLRRGLLSSTITHLSNRLIFSQGLETLLCIVVE
jgi:hypothetical protein